jgi:hypothetical protein
MLKANERHHKLSFDERETLCTIDQIASIKTKTELPQFKI